MVGAYKHGSNYYVRLCCVATGRAFDLDPETCHYMQTVPKVDQAQLTALRAVYAPRPNPPSASSSSASASASAATPVPHDLVARAAMAIMSPPPDTANGSGSSGSGSGSGSGRMTVFLKQSYVAACGEVQRTLTTTLAEKKKSAAAAAKDYASQIRSLTKTFTGQEDPPDWLEDAVSRFLTKQQPPSQPHQPHRPAINGTGTKRKSIPTQSADEDEETSDKENTGGAANGVMNRKTGGKRARTDSEKEVLSKRVAELEARELAAATAAAQAKKEAEVRELVNTAVASAVQAAMQRFHPTPMPPPLASLQSPVPLPLAQPPIPPPGYSYVLQPPAPK
jgi:hypothetical protein